MLNATRFLLTPSSFVSSPRRIECPPPLLDVRTNRHFSLIELRGNCQAAGIDRQRPYMPISMQGGVSRSSDVALG